MIRTSMLLVLCLLGATAQSLAQAETKIEWDSKDVVESRITRYKYGRGPEYERPKDPKAPNPGSNYGSITLTAFDEPPRLRDRVLKRDARLTGKIADPPKQADAGKVWIEDNYARVIDQAQVKGPDFAFKLDASRSLSTGLYLKAELSAGGKAVWSGSQEVRMVPPAGDPFADFILGIYNMGTRPGTGELFREMGLGHRAIQTTNSPAWPVQNDLRFHASNILYSLLGLYHRDLKRWREIKAAQAKARGPVRLARHRCLSSPTEEKFTTDILTAAAMLHSPYQPLFYGIGDEIGIGNMAGPYDLCGSQWCMGRFREWLQRRYGSLDKLNAQWATSYESWDGVEMFSTWGALERADSGNFAPWADRVEFMDEVLAGAVALGARVVRKIDPSARCGITGVQQPACWGYDLWKLTRAVDVMTPYDIGEGPDVIMSFYNDGADGQVVDPGFGADNEDLWRALIRGCALVQQWDSSGGVYSRMIDIEGKRLTRFGQKARGFADWVHAGPGRMRRRAVRRRDPVAILYSQPSLRGNWILEILNRKDVPETGEQWTRRDSYTVRQKELSYRVRCSWMMWLKDVGIWPKFVDASQVDEGYLTRNGYKVLVMPRAVALSDKTAEEVRKFVRAGGTVIADSWCGLMDEHCRVRAKGALDKLFGVSRGDYRKIDVTRVPADGKGVEVGGAALPFFAFEATLKAAGEAGGTFKGADVAIARKAGKGKAIYLNFNLEEYFVQRFFPKMVAPARKYLLEVLQTAGVEPLFSVVPPAGDAPFHPVGHEIAAYRSGRGYLVGVMVNPTVRNSELGGIESRYEEIKDNIFLKEMHPARLLVPAGLTTYDLFEQRAVSRSTTLKLESTPRQGHLFACWPFTIRGVTAKAEVAAGRTLRISGEVLTSSPVEDEKLVVAMRAFRPDGTEQRAYRRTIDCEKGRFTVSLPLGQNEHGDWKVVVREPCTGETAEVKAQVAKR